MRNCIIAQSGGPTTVINSSVVGVVDENLKSKYFDKVYFGLNGIEGILRGDILDTSEVPYNSVQALKLTPSSGLGSCRYKMKNYKDNNEEYEKLMKTLTSMEIETFFYVGGNDSMDTVAKLSAYASENGVDIKFIGIPKTIDNDLCFTDHTPGFGSAAKYIATTTLETYLDSCVYTHNGIFILETMGRDTGWLAASSALAMIDGKSVADFIYLPEMEFDVVTFLNDVRKTFEEKNHVYIVVSEGIKDKDGNFLSDTKSAISHDSFGHAQLGGVCGALKSIIINAGITTRVKTLELGVTQRCAMHAASLTDIDEAHMVGEYAVKYAIEGITGKMVSIKRANNMPYMSVTEPVDISDIANKIKYVPREWINEKGNGVNKEMIDYIMPLVYGDVNINKEFGLPSYIKIR